MSIAVYVLVGAAAGLGLTFIVAGAVATTPSLRAAFTLANDDADAPAPERFGRWYAPARNALWSVSESSLVRVPGEALRMLELSRERFTAHKLLGAAAGASAPILVTGAASVVGASLPLAFPAGLSLVAAGVGFLLPDASVRKRARRAQDEFTQGMIAYLTLVALERRAGAGPHQALMEAAEVADSWVWRRIRDALDHAMLQRRPTWEGLRELSRDVGVPEVADCADIVATSAEGTAVADNLLARAKSLRVETLNAQRRAANEVSERLVVPVAVLGLCFVALLLFPVVMRLTTTV